jgi:hypothetical protein
VNPRKTAGRLAAAMALALMGGGGCRPSAGATPAVDLLAELPRAERRAARAPDQSVRLDFVQSPSGSAPALLMEAPARVIYPVRLPRKARFASDVRLMPGGSAVTLRLGLSDDRRYHEVLRLPLDATTAAQPARPVAVDLARFSGRQWSLFYRPARRNWKLILNVDATPQGTAAWMHPRVEMR